MRLWLKHPTALATGSDLRHWLARNRVSLARAGVHADLGWAFPVEGKAAAEWISFETERMLARIILWEPGAWETTVARRRDGVPYLIEREQAAFPPDLNQVLLCLLGRLRLDRDVGPWWQASPDGSPPTSGS